MNEFGEEPFEPEPELRGKRRTLYSALLVIAVVVLGYVTVLFVGGRALTRAPLGRQITAIRERVGQVIAPRPPSIRLRPFERSDIEVTLSPSPIVANPSPTTSPSVVAPAPDDPSTVTFTIEFENDTGVMLTEVKITDPIPTGASYIAGSASPAASFDGDKLVWDLGNLSPGEKGNVSFKVLTQRNSLTNRATITSKEAPPSQVQSTVTVK